MHTVAAITSTRAHIPPLCAPTKTNSISELKVTLVTQVQTIPVITTQEDLDPARLQLAAPIAVDDMAGGITVIISLLPFFEYFSHRKGTVYCTYPQVVVGIFAS